MCDDIMVRPVRFLLSPRIHYLITDFARRTPLGKISGDQIRMGYATLSQISAILNEAGGTIRKRRELTNLSSEFYTRIPHCTGTPYNIGFETEGRKLLVFRQACHSSNSVLSFSGKSYSCRTLMYRSAP